MRLTIERDVLAIALSRVTPLIQRATIPILGCVKIAMSGINVTLTGQNGTASASQTALVVGAGDPGEIVVSADKFSALVNSLPKGSQLQLEATDRKLIVHYGSGRASFVIDDPKSFPIISEIEDSEPFSIDATELHRILSMALPFASQEKTRPYLEGVFLHGDETKLTAVGTDGNGMIVCRSALNVAFSGVIVPSTSCAALIRSLAGASGEVSVTVTAAKLHVALGGYSFTTRLVDGTFPDWSRVVPAPVENPVLIESGTLQEITQRAQAVTEAADATRAAPRSVRLETTGDTLHISAGSDADQRIDEDIDMAGTPGAVDVRLGTSYLLDAIASLGEGLLQLHSAEAMAPVLVRRDGHEDEFAVLMPRRG